mgnify:CR=1 FL=1
MAGRCRNLWDEYLAFTEKMETPAAKRYQQVHLGHCAFLPTEERRFITEDLIRATGGLVGTPDEIIAMLRAGAQRHAPQEEVQQDRCAHDHRAPEEDLLQPVHQRRCAREPGCRDERCAAALLRRGAHRHDADREQGVPKAGADHGDDGRVRGAQQEKKEDDADDPSDDYADGRTERCSGELFPDKSEHIFLPRFENRGNFQSAERSDGFSENAGERKHGPAKEGSSADHFDRDWNNGFE